MTRQPALSKKRFGLRVRVDYLVGCTVEFIVSLVVVYLLFLITSVGDELVLIIGVGVGSVGSLLGKMVGEVVVIC